jgi:hypothetical protein
MNSIRRPILTSLLYVALAGLNPANAQTTNTWHPVPGNLMTRWAKSVSPTKPLPDYPRPQMARKEWTNLNGLWDYALIGVEVAHPQTYQGKILVPYPIETAPSRSPNLTQANGCSSTSGRWIGKPPS